MADNKNVTDSCSVLVIYILVAIVTVLMDGLVIPILWRWFIVPVFKLPQIYFWQAAGLALLIGYFTHQTQPEDRSKSGFEKAVAAAGIAIAYPLLILGVGWVIYSIM